MVHIFNKVKYIKSKRIAGLSGFEIWTTSATGKFSESSKS